MKRSEYMAIKPQFLSKYSRRYNQVIESGVVDKIMQSSMEEIDDQFKHVYQKNGDTGIINLFGPMSEDGPDAIDLYLGYTGVAYKNLIRGAEAALKDNEIKKVIINANTPGGNVDGLDAAYQSVAYLAMKKEVITYNKGMIASAGVWYTSAAHKIIASTPSAMIGSIGVVIDTFDFSGYYTEMGIQEITITNSDSQNKRPDLTKKEGQGIIIKELDALYNVFVDRVTHGRTIGIESIKKLKGEMRIAADAVKIGLMDGIEGVTMDLAESNHSPIEINSQGENQMEITQEQLDKIASDAAKKAAVETLAGIDAKLEKRDAEAKAESERLSAFAELKNLYPNQSAMIDEESKKAGATASIAFVKKCADSETARIAALDDQVANSVTQASDVIVDPAASGDKDESGNLLASALGLNVGV